MMPGLRTEGPFPALELRDVAGVPHPLADAWREGEALILIGHHGCKTTRMTLAYVERIHDRRRHGTRVLAILQDDAESARELQAGLSLTLPLRLEPDPYPLSHALGLATVPTLFLVGRGGRIERVCEAFDRGELERFAARLGAPPPLFTAEDDAPAQKPG